MKNILIFGASGHGSVVLDCIEKEGLYNPIGFIDSFKGKGLLINGYEVLGNEKDLPRLIERLNIYGIIVAVGDNWTRKIVADKIKIIAPSLKFVSSIHPTASIGKDTVVEEGSVILAGVIINANCRIGEHCILNTKSSLDHDSIMESYSSLAPNVCTGGNLHLEQFSAICLGSNVIEGIHIKSHTVVGAGSLVIQNLKSKVVAYGSPATIVRTRKVGDPYLSASKFPYNSMIS